VEGNNLPSPPPILSVNILKKNYFNWTQIKPEKKKKKKEKKKRFMQKRKIRGKNFFKKIIK
jgi:hypothetical protein